MHVILKKNFVTDIIIYQNVKTCFEYLVFSWKGHILEVKLHANAIYYLQINISSCHCIVKFSI